VTVARRDKCTYSESPPALIEEATVATRKSLRRTGDAAEGTADREMLRRTPAEVLEHARLTTARMDDELAKAIRRRRES
jgi:hypothetical protein